MKHVIKLAAASAVATGLALTPAAAEGELFFYNWTDYTGPEVIKKFEKDTGIKVTLDTYDSNETLLAKLKSGATGYDLAVPSQNFVPIMIKEGLLVEVDVTAMPNYKNVADAFKKPTWDPEQKFSSPWQMGTTSFAIKKGSGAGTCESLKSLFEPNEKAKGNLGIFKTPEEVVNLAHIYLGQDFCTTKTEDLKAVQSLLQGMKPAVKVFSSEGMMPRLSAGTTLISGAWNGDAMKEREANGEIEYCFPKEGVVGWFDSLVIPKGAKNVENAKIFMNWVMAPENMALISNFASYANAIKGSDKYMKGSLATAPEVSVPTVPVKFGETCGAKYTKAVDKIWTRLLQ
ncbi:MAG: extracellular solute-binding protein [Pseudomonadota bacterium]